MRTQTLNRRERVVLAHLATPATLPEIATQLASASDGVDVRVRRVYSKLGVHDRASAVDCARLAGLLAAEAVAS